MNNHLLPRINARHLQAFILVHQYKSFTKAAEKLHLTQSGVSAMVRELENQLGFTLFERTTRHVQLTQAGQRFIPVASQIQNLLETNIRAIAGQSAIKKRRLRIAASPAMASGVLPGVIKAHSAAHSNDIIMLLDLPQRKILSAVENGHADIGFGLYFSNVSRITQIKLFSSAMMLISPISWSPNKGSNNDSLPIEIKHIPKKLLIKLEQNNPLQQWIDQQLLNNTSKATPTEYTRRFNNIESCVAMVEAGMGHVIAPDFITPICQRYQVSTRPIAKQAATVDFHAVRRSGVDLTAVTKDFINSFLKVIIEKNIGKHHRSAII